MFDYYYLASPKSCRKAHTPGFYTTRVNQLPRRQAPAGSGDVDAALVAPPRHTDRAAVTVKTVDLAPALGAEMPPSALRDSELLSLSAATQLYGKGTARVDMAAAAAKLISELDAANGTPVQHPPLNRLLLLHTHAFPAPTHTAPCHATRYHTTPRHAVPRHATSHHTTPRHAIPHLP